MPALSWLISDFKFRDFTDFTTYNEHWRTYKLIQVVVGVAGLISLMYLELDFKVWAGIAGIMMFYELYMLKWGHHLRVSYF